MPPSVAVLHSDFYTVSCADYAAQLSLPLVDKAEAENYTYLLIVDQQGLALQQTGSKPPGPVRVDFCDGAANHRRQFGGGELIAKAIGGDKQQRPLVLDCTAGLGKDSFVLASLGFRMILCERVPIVAALLADGIARLRNHDDDSLKAIAGRMEFRPGDARQFFQACQQGETSQQPDAVLIDPMFPESKKSAQVNKAMQAFQYLVGGDDDSACLLEQALAVARHRVVVKRPKKAPWLADKKPNFSMTGKAIRFDIYTLKAYGK